MLDPVTVSVLTHRFEAIVQEMGEAMLRTAYSQILNSSRDFSTAICDAGSRLCAQAEHVPIHVGAIPWAVASVRDAFQGRLRPGDVYLLNDPYHGNNHLPDLTAFVPVFADGEVVFWSVNRAISRTSAAPRMAPTTRRRRRSGRRGCASRPSSSTTWASCATTSSR
jgi:N-methylhydantoinase B